MVSSVYQLEVLYISFSFRNKTSNRGKAKLFCKFKKIKNKNTTKKSFNFVSFNDPAPMWRNKFKKSCFKSNKENIITLFSIIACTTKNSFATFPQVGKKWQFRCRNDEKTFPDKLVFWKKKKPSDQISKVGEGKLKNHFYSVCTIIILLIGQGCKQDSKIEIEIDIEKKNMKFWLWKKRSFS
jgi:hypothetical protein